MPTISATTGIQQEAARERDPVQPGGPFSHASAEPRGWSSSRAALDCGPDVNFDVRITEVDGTAIAQCGGQIVYGPTARCFCARLSAVIGRYFRVILDLREVTQLDACGLGMLALLIREAGSLRGRLVLAPTTDRIRRLLRVTRLDTQVQHVTSAELEEVLARR
jgi:anti-anti-sigma factor